MLSIEDFSGGDYRGLSKSLSYAENVSDIESEVIDLSEDYDKALAYIAELENILESVIDEVNEIKSLSPDDEIPETFSVQHQHPFIFNGPVRCGEVAASYANPLNKILRDRFTNVQWNNCSYSNTMSRYVQGKRMVCNLTKDWRGNVIAGSIRFGEMLFGGDYLLFPKEVKYKYSDFFKDITQPAQEELVLWNLETGVKYITELVEESTYEL